MLTHQNAHSVCLRVSVLIARLPSLQHRPSWTSWTSALSLYVAVCFLLMLSSLFSFRPPWTLPWCSHGLFSRSVHSLATPAYRSTWGLLCCFAYPDWETLASGQHCPWCCCSTPACLCGRFPLLRVSRSDHCSFSFSPFLLLQRPLRNQNFPTIIWQ